MCHGRSEKTVRRGVARALGIAAGILVPVLTACSGEPPAPRAPPWRDLDDFAGVKAIAVGDDGTVYVGGNFTRVGPQTGGGVPVSATTGEPHALFPAVNGILFAAVPDGAGGWYIGGQFTRVGGQPRVNLAHVLADGSLDPVWAPSAGFGATPGSLWVDALARDGDVIYISGAFDHLGGVARGGIGAVDATGNVTDWAPTFDGIAHSLVIRQGTVYLGGSFRTVNGEARTSLAAVDSSGALTGWNPGAATASNQPSVSVYSLAIVDDNVVVGGDFSVIGGQPRTALAALDPISGVPTSWAPRLELPGDPYGPEVLSLSVDNGTVYAGGKFAVVDGQPRAGLAAFDSTGGLTRWVPALDGRLVLSVSASGGIVYAAGEFLKAEGRTRTHFAAFDNSGALTPWDPDADDQWGRLVAASGDTVFLGGWFNWVGRATKRAGLAAIDPTGRVTDWNPGVSGLDVPREGSGMNTGSVLALAVVRGTVYVGGSFTAVGGQTRSNLTAVETSGAITDWNPGLNGPVYALDASENGLTVGGSFSRVSSVERIHLAAFDTSGRLTPWAPAPNAYVTTLARDGSTLYAGGYFTAVGGATRSTLAAFGADGTLLSWSPEVTGTFVTDKWSAPSRTPGVSGLAVHGGRVYLAGDFKTVGGLDRYGLAAVDSTGAPTAFRAGFASPTNWSFTPRALRWGFDLVLLGGAVGLSSPYNTVLSTVAIVDPASTALGSTTFAVPDDWWLNSSGRPFAEALAVNGDITYVGGAFRGIQPFPRLWLAAIDRNGTLTDWDPNVAP
jgi:hypothetical protein